MQNCYLFCLCLWFRLKVKKRYLFWRRSQVFSAFEWMILSVNIVRSSSISHFTKRCFKAQKRYIFFRFQAISWEAQKGTFFCSWKRCSQKHEKGAFLAVGCVVLKSEKKVPLIVFSSHGKPFRILLIDRCQLFGVIFMNFLSEFTNPLVKR